MIFFERIVLGNTLGHWSVSLAVTIGGFTALAIIQRILFKKLARLAQTTETTVDDLLVAVLGSTRKLTLLVVAIYIGTLFLTLAPGLASGLRVALGLTLLLQGTLWASMVVSSILKQQVDKRMEVDAASVTALTAAAFALKLVLWSLFLLLALNNLGVNVTGLVAGFGIGGIAVALAAQNILGDLFATLSIVLDKPFAVGDFIIIGEYLGTVEHIGLKTTRIRALSGEQIVCSNGDLLKSRIRNYKQMKERRVVFSIGVTYQTSYEKLKAIRGMIGDIIQAQVGVRFDRAHFSALRASDLQFEIVYFLLDPDYNVYMDTQEAINLALFQKFEAEGIAFAYPTQTVFVGDKQGANL